MTLGFLFCLWFCVIDFLLNFERMVSQNTVMISGKEVVVCLVLALVMAVLSKDWSKP